MSHGHCCQLSLPPGSLSGESKNWNAHKCLVACKTKRESRNAQILFLVPPNRGLPSKNTTHLEARNPTLRRRPGSRRRTRRRGCLPGHRSASGSEQFHGNFSAELASLVGCSVGLVGWLSGWLAGFPCLKGFHALTPLKGC